MIVVIVVIIRGIYGRTSSSGRSSTGRDREDDDADDWTDDEDEDENDDENLHEESKGGIKTVLILSWSKNDGGRFHDLC